MLHERGSFMKCPNCGSEQEPGKLYCEHCGHEIQIVPDYDPLDEMLLGEIDPDNLRPEPLHIEPETDKQKEISTAVPAPKEPKTVNNWIKSHPRRTAALLMLVLLLAFSSFHIGYLSITRDQDYNYQLRKGRSYIKKEEYDKAIDFLQRALELQDEPDESRVEIFRLLAESYAKVGSGDLAVIYMKRALNIETEESADSKALTELYLAMMELLNETGQTEELNEIVEDCPYSDIQNQLLAYRIEKPGCDTPEGVYHYYLRLNLSAEYGSIYYTLDGSMPTRNSTRYEAPIELIEEGDVLLCAVAINKKGIISEPLVLAYTLEFPAGDAEGDEEY